MPDVIEQLRRYAEAAEAAVADGPATASGRRSSGFRRLLVPAAAVVALAVVFVAAAVAVRTASDDQEVTSRSEGRADVAPRPGPGRWETFDPAPIAGRTGAVAVATDSELLVWGGRSDDLVGDGAALAFADRRWRRLAASPLSPRTSAVAVWTGVEMVVLGGFDGERRPFFDAAAYDPATDDWRALRLGLGGGQESAAAVWTGSELVVTGVVGPPGADLASDTFAVDPVTGATRALSRSPAHPERRGVAAVWTGNEVLVVSVTDGQPVTVDVLDVPSGRWVRRVTTAAEGLNTAPDGVVWTGDRLVVVGHIEPGAVYDPATGSLEELARSNSTRRFPAVVVARGVVSVGDRWLDVAARTWHEAAPIPGPFREFPIAVGHDGDAYVWGGNGCGPAASCVRFVDPAVGLVWSPP